MKFKHVITTFALAGLLGAGALVGAKAMQAKETRADDNKAVSLAGSFNGWSTTANMFTAGTDVYTLNNVEIGSGESFKVVMQNGESTHWVGQWCLNGSDEFTSTYFYIPSGSDADGNIGVSFAGTYSFSFVPNSNFDYGQLTISGTLETINVTFSVTFKADVPDYADIYLPGAFNGWSTNVSKSKMTRVDAKTFTYPAEVVPGSYQYKVVACYAGAATMDWNHQIDTSNKSIEVKATDEGNSVALGERDYDFAKNMPQEVAPEGAAVQLTFAKAVPADINIYYVGGLTNWSKNAADLAKGLMIPDAARKVYTWALPDETYTGTYEYKIVAMSANGSLNAVSYDYLVYGELSTNKQLVVDKTTLLYPLTAENEDLDLLSAIAFAQGFNTTMAGPCADQSADNKTAVSAVWSGLETKFNALTDGARTQFGKSDNADVVKARTTYVHCVDRYSLTPWTGGPAVSSRATLSTEVNNDTVVITVVIAVAALISMGGLFLLIKRRKQLD